MKRFSKTMSRLLSLLIVATMVVGMFPVSVFAAETNTFAESKTVEVTATSSGATADATIAAGQKLIVKITNSSSYNAKTFSGESGNTAVATVESGSKSIAGGATGEFEVTGVANGNTTITFTGTGSGSAYSATISLTVSDGPADDNAGDEDEFDEPDTGYAYEAVTNLTTGDYVIVVGDNNGIGTETAEYSEGNSWSTTDYNGFKAKKVTFTDGEVTGGVEADMIWSVTVLDDELYIYSVEAEQYLTTVYSSSANNRNVYLQDEADGTWSYVNSSGTYKLQNENNGTCAVAYHGEIITVRGTNNGSTVKFYRVGDATHVYDPENQGGQGGGEDGGDDQTGTTYQLVDELTTGKEYLIVSANSGNAYALKNPGGTSTGANMGATSVTIASGKIETDATDIVWTATAHTEDSLGEVFDLTNGDDYLDAYQGNIRIFSEQKYADRGWTYEGSQLEHKGSTSNTYILAYSGSQFTKSDTAASVYLFEKVVSGEGGTTTPDEPDVPGDDDNDGDSVVVISGSDYQASDSSTIMTNLMNKIKEDYPTVHGILMGGDYSAGYTTANDIVNVNSVISGVYPDIASDNRVFVQGNHDGKSMGRLTPSNSLLSTTGAHDTDYYGVYSINDDDFNGDASGLQSYLNTKIQNGYTKPIFVVSHKPLHKSSRNDNNSAVNYFSAMNDAGEAGLNIIYMFGHNHSNSDYDNYLGGGSIYLKKGDSIMVAGGNTETLEFIYMNYGYVGYCRNTADGTLTMTAFEITDDNVVIKRYDTSGLHVLKAAGVGSSGYTANTTVYQSPQTIALDGSVTPPAGGGSDDEDEPVTPPASNQYLIVSEGHALTSNEGEKYTNSSTYDYYGFDGVEYTEGMTVTSDILWTVVETTGGYYIIQGSQYLNGTYGSDGSRTEGRLKLDSTQDIWVWEGEQLKSTNASATASSAKYLTFGNGTSSNSTLFSVRSTGNATDIELIPYTGSATPPVDPDEPETPDDGYTYELDTDGIDDGAKYLIVAEEDAKALITTSANDNAVDITIEGNFVTVTSDAYDWVFTASGSGYTIQNDGTYLGRGNNNNIAEGNSSSVWSVEEADADGAYDITQSSGSNMWASTYHVRWSDSNAKFQASTTSNPVRLYKLVENGTTPDQPGQGGQTISTDPIIMQKEADISQATISQEINVGDKLVVNLENTSGAAKNVTTTNTNASAAKLSETSFTISAKSGNTNGKKSVTIEGLAAGETVITFKGSSTNGSDYYAIVNLTVKAVETEEHEHELELVTGQAATCTDAGWHDYYQCKDTECAKYFIDEDGENEIADLNTWKTGEGKINKLGHTYGDALVVFAEDGKTATVTVTCDVCVAGTDKKTVTVNVNASKIDSTEGTCQTEATETYKVEGTLEGKAYSGTKTVKGQLGNHALKKTNAVAATCVADGHEAYWSCQTAGCGKHFSNEAGTIEIANLINWLADATENGGKINKLGHTYGDAIVVFAEDGKTATVTVTCDVCVAGTDKKTVTVNVNASKIDSTEGTCQTEATETYKVEGTLEGKAYSGTKTVKGQLGNHALKKTNAVAATCVADGHEAYWSCQTAGCGKHFSNEAGTAEIGNLNTWLTGAGKIAKLNHTYGEVAIEWAADGKTADVTVTCNVCAAGTEGKTLTEKVNATIVSSTAGTCQDEGVTIYKVEGTIGGKSYSDTETIEGAKGAHILKKTNAQAATCVADGHEAYWSCQTAGCGKHFSNEAGTIEIANLINWLADATENGGKINKLGHTYGDAIVVFAEDGKTATVTVTCDVCVAGTDKKTVTVNVNASKIDSTEGTCQTEATETYKVEGTLEGKAYSGTKTVKGQLGNHALKKTNAVAATCVADGHEAYWSCQTAGCGKHFSNEAGTAEIGNLNTWLTGAGKIAKLNHTYGEVAIEWAADGKTADVTVTCNVCAAGTEGKTLTEKVNATVKSSTEGDCQTKATITYTISGEIGGKAYTDDKTVEGQKNLNKHVGGTEIRDAQEETCGEDGFTGNEHCKSCGTKVKNGTVIPATGEHNFENGFCTECEEEDPNYVPEDPGVQQYLIVSNGYALSTAEDGSYQNTGSSNSQKYNYSGFKGVQYATRATVTPDMLWTIEETNGGFYIKQGGKYLNATYESNSTGGYDGVLKLDDVKDIWTWENNKLKSTNASANASSAKYLTCGNGNSNADVFSVRSSSNATNFELIPYGEHKHSAEKVNKIEASCKETGIEAHWFCEGCGGYFIDENCENETTAADLIIAKKPHTEETIPGTAATCTKTGLTDGKKCSTCNEVLVEQEVILMQAHDYVDGVCSACGAEEPKFTKVDKITSGKKYVIVIDNSAMGTETGTATSSSNTYTGLKASGVTIEGNKIISDVSEDMIWLITESNGKYTIKNDKTGTYLNAEYSSSSSGSGGWPNWGSGSTTNTRTLALVSSNYDTWTYSNSNLGTTDNSNNCYLALLNAVFTVRSDYNGIANVYFYEVGAGATVEPDPDQPGDDEPVVTTTVNITSAKEENGGTTANATIEVDQVLTINLTNGSSTNPKDYTVTVGNGSYAQVTSSTSFNLAASASAQVTVKGLAVGNTTITMSGSGAGSVYVATINLNVVAKGSGEIPEQPDVPVVPGTGSNIGFTSDMHDETGNLRNWLNGVQNAVDPNLEYMAFGGDFTYNRSISSFNTAVSIVNELVGTNKGVYTTGNHEYDNSSVAQQMANTQGFKRIGLAVDAPNYDIYTLGAHTGDGTGAFQDSDITALGNYLKTAPTDEPIFIVTHYPLHYFSWRTIGNADDMIDLLNLYPNVIFVWGHNHSQGDGMYGQILTAGDSITYANGQSKKINFTYLSAGAMRGDRDPYRGMVANVNASGDTVTLTYYGNNGAVTNVTETIYIAEHECDIKAVAKKEATCTEAGMEAHFYCAGCDKYFSDENGVNEVSKESLEIAMIEHNWGTVTYTWTGYTKCVAEHTCSNGTTHKETIEAQIANQITVQATCESAGERVYTATFAQSWAATQTKTEPIAAKNHAWSVSYTWSTDGKTCTATHICANDAQHNETANATVTAEQSKAPTCGDKGETTYTATFTASWATKQTKVIADIDATGEHDFENGKCTVCKAADPDYVPENPVKVTGKTLEDGTYVIVANGKALTNVVHSGYTNSSSYKYSGFEGGTITISDDEITEGVTDAIIFEIKAEDGGYTIMQNGQYLSATYTQNSGNSGWTGTLTLSSTKDIWTWDSNGYLKSTNASNSSKGLYLVFDNVNNNPSSGSQNNMFGIRSDSNSGNNLDAVDFYLVGEPKQVTKIEIATAPAKLEYYVGQNFVADGLVLKVTYDDNTTANISSGYTVENGTNLKAEQESVTISYRGQQVALEITVTERISTGEVYLAFTSDVHNKSDNTSANRLNTWLNNVSNKIGDVFEVMGFSGDMADASASASNYWTYAQKVMDVVTNNNNVQEGFYVAGNHEHSPGNVTSNSSAASQAIRDIGETKVTGDYAIYSFGAATSSQSFNTSDINNLDAWLEDNTSSTMPVFVISHFPIHYYSSRTTSNAQALVNVLNKYPNVIFLWGHNHTLSDSYYDEVYTAGDQLQLTSGGNSWWGDSSSATYATINFTYAAAGCMSGSEYSSGSNSVQGKGLVAKVDGSVVTLTYYDENGNAKTTPVTIELEEHEHTYTWVAAQAAVHTQTELKAAVAAHYFCDECDTYFTAAYVETTLAELTGETPVHSYGNWINTDANQHWKECSCGLKAQTDNHEYNNAQDTDCNTCGYVRTIAHEHTFATTWSYDANNHWYAATCGHDVTRDLEAHHGGNATCDAKAICVDCGQAYGTFAQHSYTWVAAQAEVHTQTELKAAVAAHYFCDECDTYFTAAYVETTLAELTGETPVHSYGNWINTDANKHWQECSCGLKTQEGTHVYTNNADADCNTCGHVRTVQHDLSIAFKAASLTLEDNIAINFKAEVTEGAGYVGNYTVGALFWKEEPTAYTINHEGYLQIEEGEEGYSLETSSGRHVFTYSDIAAKEMNDDIYLVAYIKTADNQYIYSSPLTYSVVKCAKTILNPQLDFDDEFKTLAVDMLNYGAAAQIYFNYRTDALANASLTENELAYGTSGTVSLENGQAFYGTANANAQFTHANLTLESAVWLNYKAAIKAPQGRSIRKVTLFYDDAYTTENAWVNSRNNNQLNSTEMELVADYVSQNGEVQYVGNIKNLAAKDLRDLVYAQIMVTYSDGSVAYSNILQYSVESFAWRTHNMNDANLSQLADALMKYGDSAKTYLATLH